MRSWKQFASLLCAFGMMCVTCVQPASAVQSAVPEVGENNYTYEIEWLNDVDFVLRGYLDGKLVDEVSGSVGAETMLAKEFNEQGDLIKEETVTVSDIIKPAPQEVVDELKDSGLEEQVSPLAYDTYAGYVSTAFFVEAGMITTICISIMIL